jgi:hypothetical protein
MTGQDDTPATEQVNPSDLIRQIRDASHLSDREFEGHIPEFAAKFGQLTAVERAAVLMQTTFHANLARMVKLVRAILPYLPAEEPYPSAE